MLMDKDVPADPEAAERNPQPTDICLTIETVDAYKRSDCRFYLKCLDVASIKGWQQFHCNDCTAYVPIPESARKGEALITLAVLREKVRQYEGQIEEGKEQGEESGSEDPVNTETSEGLVDLMDEYLVSLERNPEGEE